MSLTTGGCSALRTPFLVCALLAAGFLPAHRGLGEDGTPAAAPIPEAHIAALKQELAESAQQESRTDVRRATKSVIRKALDLLEQNPDAPIPYALLALLFEGQKRVLSLEATERNREALFETCQKLREAPDAYAEARFEADMLLSERDLAEAEATVAERTAALNAMLARYRGTPAEWKSLVIGSMIATSLLQLDLEQKIDETMVERFGGDHAVIEFRRKKHAETESEAVFSGRYTRADGTTLVFPEDRFGHQYLAYFWSQTTPDIETHLKAIQEIQSRHPGVVEIYSFNLDELPDAGAAKLRSLGLDWPALRLPGGRENSAYKAYARRDPAAVFVNAQGNVLLAPISEIELSWDPAKPTPDAPAVVEIEERLDDPRYLAQLQYLGNGDWLAGDALPPADLAGALEGIQACFTPAPFRYRLTPDQALARYREAETRCAAAIKQHESSPAAWRLRNDRIIALIGLWNMEAEPKHLAEAVKEAQIVLGMKLPPGADVVARFCLTKDALRRGDQDAERRLANFIQQAGGDAAPPQAIAAAAILALGANARGAYAAYRQRLLDETADKPALWSVVAFLRDRHHRYRNFHASPGGQGYARPQKYAYRHMVAGLTDPVDRTLRFETELLQPGGGQIGIPNVAEGQPLGVIFAEPPPTTADRTGLMNQVRDFAGEYARLGIKVVVVFLSDDPELCQSLLPEHDRGLLAGMLPNGLGNPLVQQLGILSADRIPNPFLLRPDGSVAWSISGLRYRVHAGFGGAEAIKMAIEPNIEKMRLDPAFEALERGEFQKALRHFEQYSPPQGTDDWWAADRLHGQALAQMGLRDWDAALTSIEAALKSRAGGMGDKCRCHGVVEMHLTKATILDQLGRGADAAEERARAAAQTLPHPALPPRWARSGVPIGVYYDWLKRIRLGIATKS